jgi:hypothetical protein
MRAIRYFTQHNNQAAHTDAETVYFPNSPPNIYSTYTYTDGTSTYIDKSDADITYQDYPVYIHEFEIDFTNLAQKFYHSDFSGIPKNLNKVSIPHQNYGNYPHNNYLDYGYSDAHNDNGLVTHDNSPAFYWSGFTDACAPEIPPYTVPAGTKHLDYIDVGFCSLLHHHLDVPNPNYIDTTHINYTDQAQHADSHPDYPVYTPPITRHYDFTNGGYGTAFLNYPDDTSGVNSSYIPLDKHYNFTNVPYRDTTHVNFNNVSFGSFINYPDTDITREIDADKIPIIPKIDFPNTPQTPHTDSELVPTF